MMVENFPNLAKNIYVWCVCVSVCIYLYLQIQEAEQILKRINSKKSTPKHIKIKFLKTKNKNFQNQWEKSDTSLSRENNLNDGRFLITHYWGWKEEARHFLSVKIKGLSSQNFISNNEINILQAWRVKFPGGPVVRILCFTAGGTGLIPGQGTKISYVVWAWPKTKTKKNKK